jgi:hypothetical protein
MVLVVFIGRKCPMTIYRLRKDKFDEASDFFPRGIMLDGTEQWASLERKTLNEKLP